MSAPRAAGRRQGAGVPPPGRGRGSHVGGAALGRAASLDEAASSVRILLRLQGGGGEDVGGQPPQLIGPRLVPVLFQLQTDQSETGRGGRLMSGNRPFIKINALINIVLQLRPNTLI